MILSIIIAVLLAIGCGLLVWIAMQVSKAIDRYSNMLSETVELTALRNQQLRTMQSTLRTIRNIEDGLRGVSADSMERAPTQGLELAISAVERSVEGWINDIDSGRRTGEEIDADQTLVDSLHSLSLAAEARVARMREQGMLNRSAPGAVQPERELPVGRLRAIREPEDTITEQGE